MYDKMSVVEFVRPVLLMLVLLTFIEPSCCSKLWENLIQVLFNVGCSYEKRVQINIFHLKISRL